MARNITADVLIAKGASDLLKNELAEVLDIHPEAITEVNGDVVFIDKYLNNKLAKIDYIKKNLPFEYIQKNSKWVAKYESGYRVVGTYDEIKKHEGRAGLDYIREEKDETLFDACEDR